MVLLRAPEILGIFPGNEHHVIYYCIVDTNIVLIKTVILVRLVMQQFFIAHQCSLLASLHKRSFATTYTHWGKIFPEIAFEIFIRSNVICIMNFLFKTFENETSTNVCTYYLHCKWNDIPPTLKWLFFKGNILPLGALTVAQYYQFCGELECQSMLINRLRRNFKTICFYRWYVNVNSFFKEDIY